MDLQNRIQALEAELADLKKAASKTVPQPPKDNDRPLISYPQPPSIELPDGGQQRKLIEIISGRHPKLTPRYSVRWADQEEGEFFVGLATAMRYISTLGRTASVDRTRYLSFWTDQCKDWARLNDVSPIGNVGAAFYLAAIAMGIPYQLGNSATGDLPAVGLKQHGGERITSEGWKRVLNGKLMAPVAPERRFAAPSPSQILVAR